MIIMVPRMFWTQINLIQIIQRIQDNKVWSKTHWETVKVLCKIWISAMNLNQTLMPLLFFKRGNVSIFKVTSKVHGMVSIEQTRLNLIILQPLGIVGLFNFT